MKKIFLVAALLGGMSFSSMAGELYASSSISTTSLKIEENASEQPKFAFAPPLTNDYLFEVCGHQEYVCCLTAEGAAEYAAYLVGRYC